MTGVEKVRVVVSAQAKQGQLDLEFLRQLADGDDRDKDHLVPLIAEALNEGGTNSVLVFCASRKQCQSCADIVADLLPDHLPPVSEVILFFLLIRLCVQQYLMKVASQRMICMLKTHTSRFYVLRRTELDNMQHDTVMAQGYYCESIQKALGEYVVKVLFTMLAGS